MKVWGWVELMDKSYMLNVLCLNQKNGEKSMKTENGKVGSGFWCFKCLSVKMQQIHDLMMKTVKWSCKKVCFGAWGMFEVMELRENY